MTAPAGQDLDLRQIEQFLYREARYADEHDYDAWEALWTDDASYWVPAGGDLGRAGHLPPASGGRRASAGRQAGPAGQPRAGAAYAGVLDLNATQPGEDELAALEDEGSGASAAGGVVDSEFADVAVTVDTTANGPRLRLQDRRTGRVRFLDALELETIIWLPEGHLTQLLDPSADRWRDP
jgi:hypothetical protein